MPAESYASSPAVARRTAYFGSDNGTVYCGEHRHRPSPCVEHSPLEAMFTQAGDGRRNCCFGGDDDELYALNAANGHLGSVLQQKRLRRRIHPVESLAVTVYFGSKRPAGCTHSEPATAPAPLVLQRSRRRSLQPRRDWRFCLLRQ